LKILIIDDNIELSMLTKKALIKYDHDIVICNDTSDAIDFVQIHDPDLILIDIMMPGLSGPDIVKSLKMDPKLKDTPVLFLSGLMTGKEKDLEKEGLNVDGVIYPILGKPYRSEELVGFINRYAV